MLSAKWDGGDRGLFSDPFYQVVYSQSLIIFALFGTKGMAFSCLLFKYLHIKKASKHGV